MTTQSLKDAATALQPELVALRRDLHAHPELAFEETRTAALISERLARLGMRVESIGGTGVLAVLKGAAPGKTVMLRCDIDAVEQLEAEGRPYGSTIPGRNHSCGHDINMTIALGVAEVLAARRDEIHGNVAFVFQPADEPMSGARKLFGDGLWDRVAPDAILALHIAPDIDAGRVIAHGGAVWASLDTLTLKLTRGSATPAVVPDITLAAAQLVSALYGAIGSETTAMLPVTFSVSSISARQQRGAPVEASIELRLATFDNDLRARLLKRIESVSTAVAAGFDATVAIERTTDIPAIINDPEVSAVVAASVRDLLGEAALVPSHRHAVPDDFSLFLEHAPGCMVLFGTANASKGITAMWHTPEYDADEDMLQSGVAVMAESVLRLL